MSALLAGLQVWYRATHVDVVDQHKGSELVSMGDNVVLRIWADRIEFGKQTSPTGGTFAKCFAMIPGGQHLDGSWHHLAGVSSAEGMRIYLDGQETCSNTSGQPVHYTEGQDLWVGRHALALRGRFDGHLDEIRVYARALTSTEINWLATGGQ